MSSTRLCLLLCALYNLAGVFNMGSDRNVIFCKRHGFSLICPAEDVIWTRTQGNLPFESVTSIRLSGAEDGLMLRKSLFPKLSLIVRGDCVISVPPDMKMINLRRHCCALYACDTTTTTATTATATLEPTTSEWNTGAPTQAVEASATRTALTTTAVLTTDTRTPRATIPFIITARVPITPFTTNPHPRSNTQSSHSSSETFLSTSVGVGLIVGITLCMTFVMTIVIYEAIRYLRSRRQALVNADTNIEMSVIDSTTTTDVPLSSTITAPSTTPSSFLAPSTTPSSFLAAHTSTPDSLPSSPSDNSSLNLPSPISSSPCSAPSPPLTRLRKKLLNQ